MFKLFLFLNFLALPLMASPYQHLPPKEANKLAVEGQRICDGVKEFAEKENDEPLKDIFERHCVKPKEPLLTGLLIGIYHLDVDTHDPGSSSKERTRKLFYKKQLAKLSLLVKRYPDFSTPLPLFNISKNITELSGFTLFKPSQTVWSHGDSGNPTMVAQTSLIDRKTTTIQVSGVTNIDWEAITSDSENIWILDVGDNPSERKSIQFYRFLAKDVQNGKVDKVTRFDLRLPEGAMDCEAGVYYDHAIYLFQKKYFKPARVYKVALKNGVPQKPELIGHFPSTGPITDATLNDQNQLFILTYFGVFEVQNWLKPDQSKFRQVSLHTWGQTESLVNIKEDQFWVGREDGNVYELRDTGQKQPL